MFLLNLLLALAWVALTGQFTPVNFVIGFALAYLLLWLAQRTAEPAPYFGKARQALGFALFFLWQMIKANLQVAYSVLTPRYRMRPGVIAIPLDVQTDAEITLLANLITLTPGTLSLDVSADRRVLYVHSMVLGDDVERFRREVKEGFERRVLEVLR
ncbi:MAG: Na+/H+ antiporter subunit E [Chloroflexi bacterium]|nr:Na+/H+ antiporter subunit E [Chloroflexota bacterium]